MSEKRGLGKFVFGGVLGTLGALFFDPQEGRRRRAMLVDRSAALFRRTGRRAERAGRGVGVRVSGMSQQVQHLKEEPKDFDDVTLARKVETDSATPTCRRARSTSTSKRASSSSAARCPIRTC